MEKVLPKDVYEVTRNADTERPLQVNTGIRMKRNLLLRCLRQSISGELLVAAKLFEQDNKDSVIYKR
jgi:hypothetical protein